MRALPGLLLVAMLACSDDPEPMSDAGMKGCFTGDRSLTPELVILHRDVDGQIVETRPDQDVPLIQPPQGGKVLFFAARARHLDGCPVQLTASMRDDCTNEVISVESRRVLMKPTDDGWLVPDPPDDISSFSNLPVCPKIGSPRELEGEFYRIRVRLEDGAGRTAEASVRVRSVCAEPEFLASCLCECDERYVLGVACGVDTSTVTRECR